MGRDGDVVESADAACGARERRVSGSVQQLYGLALPLLRLLDPEAAHRLTVWGLERGPRPARTSVDDPVLAIRLWGRDFRNPVGLAAGFDKDARVADAMAGLGFGFVEVGSVTPRPQPGNPRPRLFRLGADRAIINRLGFNSEGLVAVAARLARRDRGAALLGVNLGANADSADVPGDYLAGLTALGGLADYFVVNISSPNTPGLRSLQERDAFDALLARIGAARAPDAPLLVKIAPDLDGTALEDIVGVAIARGIDGIIVGNTSTGYRDGLRSRHRGEAGGLSGKPLMEPSTALLREAHRLAGGRITLVGTGGIASGGDAYAKIRAGASLVQLYTALVFQGPALIGRIKADLAARLKADGFTRVADAVGADLR